MGEWEKGRRGGGRVVGVVAIAAVAVVGRLGCGAGAG